MITSPRRKTGGAILCLYEKTAPVERRGRVCFTVYSAEIM